LRALFKKAQTLVELVKNYNKTHVAHLHLRKREREKQKTKTKKKQTKTHTTIKDIQPLRTFNVMISVDTLNLL